MVGNSNNANGSTGKPAQPAGSIAGAAVEQVFAVSDGQGGGHAYEQRMLAIHAMREEGLTLQAIGDTFNLSRERIRQILAESHGPTAEQVRAYRRTQQDAQRGQDREALVAWLRTNAGKSLHQAQAALGWAEQRLASAMSRDAHRLAVQSRDGAAYRQFSDKQTLAALRKAWDLVKHETGHLSFARYQSLVDTGAVQGPSAVRVIQVFETWRRAAEFAGVPAGQVPNRAYGSNWTDGEILSAVVRYLEDPSTRGTFAGWDEWRRGNAPDAPSGALVRIRLGQWSRVKALALEASAARAGSGKRTSQNPQANM